MQSFKSLLTKNYSLTHFLNKDSGFTFLKALLWVLLPNIFLLLVVAYLGLSRPLINLDYLLASLLFVLPFRVSKILACVAFLVVFVFDIIMITMQIFPFMDMAAITYLAPFLLQAPARYMIMVAVIVCYLLGILFVQWRYAKKVAVRSTICAGILLGGLYTLFGHVQYYQAPAEHFGRSNYFIFGSQYSFYKEHYDAKFIWLGRNVPTITPMIAKQNYASKKLLQPTSDKILFIIAESWGVAREESVKKEMLKGIYDFQDGLEFMHDGYFDFAGATVEAELRELCQIQITGGYALSKTEDGKLSHCLPNVLQQGGHDTVALHGSSSQLYDRLNWYSKAGFKQSFFAENVPDAKRCHPFHGICDNALLPLVSKTFAEHKDKKLFFYWLTLTAHAPYAESDIDQNNRLDCDKFQLLKGDICNNMKLHTQFFDGLATLIRQPEMKGVEVIVVGDHMPPIVGHVPVHKNLHWNDVPWLHFKVK